MSAAPDPPNRRVELSLIGAPRWRTPDASGTLSRLDAALLGLLVLGGPQPRDRVAAWLWPQAPLRNANLNLRQRLFKLRHLVGHPLVEAGALLRLADGVSADVAAEPAVEGGELLGGFDYGDLDAFDQWLTQQRDALERRRLDAQARLAARLEESGALAEAIHVCEEIVARRPTMEHIWRRLMRLHYLRGDRAAAVAAFEAFETGVCREWGLRPTAETLALLDTIERMPTESGRAGVGPLPASLLRPPRLIGRDAEMAQLAHAWEARRPVLVSGQGGIGKSRLLEDFLAGIPGVLRVAARPGDSGMPYATMSVVLARANELFSPRLATPWREELARLVAAFGAPPAWPAQEARLWQAIEAMLAACHDEGLQVLALDDVHEADEATLATVHWLLASPKLSTLRWVLSARTVDAEQDSMRRLLGDSQRVEPIPLEPLSAAAVAKLVDSLALPFSQPVNDAFVAALHQYSGGNPFFTLETLKSIVQQGGDPSLPLPRPAAADALIARRLRRLTPPAQDVARWLAVAGPALGLDVASRVLGCPLPHLARAFGELQAEQLVRETDFAHGLIRQCVLTQMPEAGRRALHLAIAAELDAQPDAAPIHRAEHWLGGGDWRRAAGALADAAQQARRAGRLAEYESLLMRAAEAAGKAGDEAARFDNECRALSARMLRHGAASILEPLQNALATTREPSQRSRLNALQCEAQLNLGHATEALRAGEAAMAEAAAGSERYFEAVVLYGRALAMNARVKEAIEALEAARAQARRLADRTTLMQVNAALAHALFSAHRHVEALDAQQQALRAAEQSGDGTEIAHHESNLASIALNVGDAPLAHRAASDAHRRFEMMGMADGHYVVNAVTLARLATHLGLLDEAHRVLEPLLSSTKAVGDSIFALVQLSALTLHLILGDAEAARARLATLAGFDGAKLLPTVHAAVLLARLRQAHAAGEDCEPLHGALEALGRQHPTLREYALVYCVWADWDDPQQALPRLMALAGEQARQGALGAARSLELAAVRILARQKEHREAARLAWQLAEQPDAPWLATVHPPEAWWTLAQALSADGRYALAAYRCVERGRAWLEAATLPAGALPCARRRLRDALPAHRALWPNTDEFAP